MNKSPLTWAVDATAPDMTQAERIAWMNGGAKDEIDRAFTDGVVVDYERRYVGDDNQDVEIRVVLRHKSALKPEV